MEFDMKYNDIVSALRKVAPESCEYEAGLLVEAFTDLKISQLRQSPESELGDLPSLANAIARRQNHEPLQYIIGKWDFYRQTYKVNENCLIPRSDTEVLVEHAIELLPHGAHFLDLCTGSGCIAVSTLAERADTTAVMVDKFEKALALALENAELNGVSERVGGLCLDVFEDGGELDREHFDAILSNPPYIRPEVIKELAPELKHEPYAALYGGEDGLIFYRRIVSRYSRLLKKDGFFLLEIGYDQAADVANIAAENGFACKIFKDYSGNDRVALLTK